MSCPFPSFVLRNLAFTEATCDALPDVATYLTRFGFENITVVTEDDYVLEMAHVTTDFNGDPSDNVGRKGPLLVIHDQDTDGTSFLENFDNFEPRLVTTFFNDGWDLYIANMRGTKPSRKHNTFDPDGTGADGAADYWNFDISTQAEFDVPAMVNAI